MCVHKNKTLIKKCCVFNVWLSQQQIRKKEAEALQLEDKLERNKAQKQLMSEFLKRAQQELKNTEVGQSKYVVIYFVFVTTVFLF